MTLRHGRKAFTLVEVLLALSVAGLLLTYAAFQIVSLSTIWAHRADEDFFSEHADGVAHFLNAAFERATAPARPVFNESGAQRQGENGGGNGENPDEDDNGQEREDDSRTPRPAGNTQVSARGVSLKHPPGGITGRPPLLYFTQLEPPPLLSEADIRGLPGIEAFLQFDSRNGLAISWYAPMLISDDRVEESDLRTTLLSQYVTQVEYIYRDPQSDRWDAYRELREELGIYQLPAFLRLTFRHGEDELTRIIRVPPGTPSVPSF